VVIGAHRFLLIGPIDRSEPASRWHRRGDTVVGMCRRITCATCGKPSWAGCGAHVEQILADVAPADRCTCGPGERKSLGLLQRLRRR
jgi:hypothetical protein